MAKTFLVAVSSKGLVGRTFVVPDIVSPEPRGFIGLERPLRADHAVVVYTGTLTTPEDVMARFWTAANRPLPEDAFESLRAFLEQLASFRIGNLLAVAYDTRGGFQLKKEADRLPPLRAPKLP
jgi:hypothetical protein